MSANQDPTSYQNLLAIPITTKIPDEDVEKVLTNPPFINIPKASNFRDIGLVTGSTIKPGLIYRSGALHSITPENMPLLQTKLGITTVFDLRQDQERDRHPSPEITGIKTVWLKTKQVPVRFLPAEYVKDSGVPGYLRMYDEVLRVYDEFYREVLLYIRDNPDSPILFHCTAGKDRTGVLAVILLNIAGTPKETITFDYTLTRVGIEREREFLIQNLKNWLGEDVMDQPGVLGLSSISKRVGDGFQERLEAEYGGVEGYCKNRLGFTDEDLVLIRKNLLG